MTAFDLDLIEPTHERPLRVFQCVPGLHDAGPLVSCHHLIKEIHERLDLLLTVAVLRYPRKVHHDAVPRT